ncbi:hypothetical protein [Variovorax sp. 38R]|uniref:hypothetical protein n=1 Tax=Variovorax sp. 38R TaxID=2774875 RepID=UPI000FBEFBDA|nr:hypothetical protein [Variovorax sp. 38R]QOF77603.1 hypothetical protein IG196_25165 [Variovorax sp. 38R]
MKKRCPLGVIALVLMSGVAEARDFEAAKLVSSNPNPAITGWTCSYQPESEQRFELNIPDVEQCFTVVSYDPLRKMVSMPARRPFAKPPSPVPATAKD